MSKVKIENNKNKLELKLKIWIWKGKFEFNVEENWSDDQNRARRYRMGAIAVVMQTGGTSDPRYNVWKDWKYIDKW